MFPQDMRRCGPKGRDCIEANSTRSFNCSVSCVGIYADIHWEDGGMGKEMEDESDDVDYDEEIGEEVLDTKIVKRITKMEIMYNDLKKEMDLMKGKKGEELDKEKFLKLIAEYKNFKKKNVQHFRFSSVANLSNFGKHTYIYNAANVKQCAEFR